MHVTKNNRKSNEKLKKKRRWGGKKRVTGGGVRGVSPEGETGIESTVVKFVEEVGFKSGVKREEVMAGENVNRQRKTRARNRGICTRLSERNRELLLCTVRRVAR